MSRLSRMQVSQMLQRLSDSGLVTVEPHELDRRERLIVLVEATDRAFLSNVRIN